MEALSMTNSRAAQTRKAGTPGPEGSVAKLAYAEENKRIYDLCMDLMGADAMLFPAGYPMVRPDLVGMNFDLVLAPNFSVWRTASRWDMVVQTRRSLATLCELVEAGVPAVPDIGFSFFEPDGRLWAEWINSQPHLQAVSIFCGGRKIHAEVTANRETVEDIALLHQAVRPDVTFILGGIHTPARLVDSRRAAPGRRLVICNGMPYALAQRRRRLHRSLERSAARSARDCFLLNNDFNDRVYSNLLHREMADAV